MVTEVRKGMPDPKLTKKVFASRFLHRFFDPAFDPIWHKLEQACDIAWQAYQGGRKAPRTRPAGPGFADPKYELSEEWLATRDAIKAAEAKHSDSASPSRVLIINGSSRSEHSCPGEMSKTYRLVEYR